MSYECQKIHEFFNNLQRFNFPIEFEKIPLNGIYILFEKGESGHGLDRIVRIGTHTGDNLLRTRLKQHFIIENKDGSIFRKNIGRTILNKKRDPYLKVWDLAMTTKESVANFGYLVDKEYHKNIEKEVSKYIQNNFSFCVFEINDKSQRLAIESMIISTVAQCDECKPSERWFGLNSPLEKIKQSGLWQVNELFKNRLKENDINMITNPLNSKTNNFNTLPKREIISFKNGETTDNIKTTNVDNKIWVNINKPTKKCTIHTNQSCPFVLSISETFRKGVEELKIDGGWKSFPGFIQAQEYCRNWIENKGYTITTCC